MMFRNPWGKKAFNGDWSEHSPLWKAVPQDLQPNEGIGNSAKGIFWIGESDFLK